MLHCKNGIITNSSEGTTKSTYLLLHTTYAIIGFYVHKGVIS